MIEQAIRVSNNPPHFVGFRLDRQSYALPLDHVERALRMVAITPVPEAQPWVPGVINLHGRVIPVVDLRPRFSQPPKAPAPEDRLLVVRVLEQTVALMVDEVTEVLEVPAHQVEPPPEPVSHSRPLAAVIRQDEGLTLILDVAQLLPAQGEAEMQ
jgi:purine-binding chemotaxis protein CheW